MALRRKCWITVPLESKILTQNVNFCTISIILVKIYWILHPLNRGTLGKCSTLPSLVAPLYTNLNQVPVKIFNLDFHRISNNRRKYIKFIKLFIKLAKKINRHRMHTKYIIQLMSLNHCSYKSKIYHYYIHLLLFNKNLCVPRNLSKNQSYIPSRKTTSNPITQIQKRYPKQTENSIYSGRQLEYQIVIWRMETFVQERQTSFTRVQMFIILICIFAYVCKFMLTFYCIHKYFLFLSSPLLLSIKSIYSCMEKFTNDGQHLEGA